MAIDRNEYLCDNLEIVGLIPAAGKAERIQPLPCSKELIPTGFYASVEKRRPRVRVAMSHLLESLRCAGVKKAFVVLRKGKWDIPNYFGCGKACGPQLAYIITEVLVGVPYTIDQAYSFIKDCQVLFGFPDIIFKPSDAFKSLIKSHNSTGADITLGLFPSPNPSMMDMVETSSRSRVKAIQIKPSRTRLKYTWVVCIWSRQFYDFLHGYLKGPENLHRGVEESRELQMGDVIQKAIESGLMVESVKFSNGRCRDIGTPEGLEYLLGQGSGFKI